MGSNYELIRGAIASRSQVTAVYQGHYREMCPHVIGRKNGREQALFYQFAGETSKGPVVPGSTGNWRCIPIEGLEDVAIREGEWQSANNHSRPQTCIDEIDLEIAF